MNEDRIKGALKEAQGNIKEATGKAVGNEKLKREGQVERVEGKAQNMVGQLKDAFKGNLTRH